MTRCRCQRCPRVSSYPRTDLAIETTRARVIAAHKQLMAMNDANAEAFKDLVDALEQEQGDGMLPADNS